MRLPSLANYGNLPFFVMKMQILHFPLLKICQNTDFLWPVLSLIRAECTIISLCRKIKVKDNPYSGIFHTVSVKWCQLLIKRFIYYKHISFHNYDFSFWVQKSSFKTNSVEKPFAWFIYIFLYARIYT